jgi:3-phosphoshikimate 1-carboxyvinyltransferase
MTTLIVHPASRPLVGSVPVPPDAAIGRVALIVSALASGRSRVTGASRAAEHAPVVGALRSLGVTIDDAVTGQLVVEGAGLRGLRAPAGDVDCGASASTLRLLCGVLAGQPFASRLSVDASLARIDVGRVIAALRARGSAIDGRASGEEPSALTPPVTIAATPPQGLGALECASPAPSADLKGAVLLSGLAAAGTTRFVEPTVSADHVERLLVRLGAPLRTFGAALELDPTSWDGALPSLDLALPGDVSAAAALIAAAQIVPGSQITARAVGVNPTRTGVLRVARDIGAAFTVEPKGESAGEPIAEIHAGSASLRATAAGGEALAGADDDLPIVCALAARASGTTRVFTAARGDHGDRLAAMRDVLRAFGVRCEPHGAALEIEGRDGPLAAAEVDAAGDPRVAIAAVVLGLAAAVPARVRGAGSIASVYPKLVATLRSLGATIDVGP